MHGVSSSCCWHAMLVVAAREVGGGRAVLQAATYNGLRELAILKTRNTCECVKLVRVLCAESQSLSCICTQGIWREDVPDLQPNPERRIGASSHPSPRERPWSAGVTDGRGASWEPPLRRHAFPPVRHTELLMLTPGAATCSRTTTVYTMLDCKAQFVAAALRTTQACTR